VGASLDITALQQVKNNRLWLASIVESSNDAILSFDGNRNIMSWNVGAQQVFGYSDEEAVGQPMSLLAPPEYQAEQAATFTRLWAGESVYQLESVRQRQNGESFPASITASPIRDEDGQVVGITSIVQDIRQRKQVEDALRESQERFRIAVDAAELATWDWDIVNGSVKWNERHYRLFGLEPSDDLVRYDYFEQFVHPDDRAWVRGRLERAVAECGVYEAEFRVITTNGSQRWMSGYGRVVEQQNGRALRMGGAMFDTTARRESENALRESEERFRLLVEGTRDYAMFLMNPERCIIHWNSGAERLFGYTRDEALGLSGDMIFTPEDRAVCAPDEEAQTAVQEGSALDVRWHLRKDGSLFWADGINTALYHANGELRGFVKITRDATREKEIAEELQHAHDELEARVVERTAQLASTNQRLQNEAVQRHQAEEAREKLLLRLVSVQEEERLRISRELHDQMGQQLTALLMGLKALPTTNATTAPRDEPVSSCKKSPLA
jgi:PAS domain S-box-containing protein